MFRTKPKSCFSLRSHLVTFSEALLFLSHKQSSDDEECSAKGRNRHIVVSKAELSNSVEVLESFKLARESWELLYSLEFLDKGEGVLLVVNITESLSGSSHSSVPGVGIHSFHRIPFWSRNYSTAIQMTSHL